ncbi:MAG: DUF1775 domain-containing protein [Mycobacteriales bacterium]|nr:DUF1775 domain-containing protein [Mycobacteriales bacterium]
MTTVRARSVATTLALTLTTTTAALVLAPAVAQAHVDVTPARVTAGTVVELSLRAPVETQGTTNRKVYALVPGPLVVRDCAVPSPSWTCTPDTTTRPGSTFVTWETPTAGAAADVAFALTVEVPATAPATELKLPVVQTYAEGTVARWIDDGDPSPAPRLIVVAAAGGPASTSPTAASTSSPAATSTGTSPAGDGDSGAPVLLLGLVGLGLLGAVGAGTVVLRRRP